MSETSEIFRTFNKETKNQRNRALWEQIIFNIFIFISAEKSIQRFREIELKSGIPFFNENGFMNVLSESEADQVKQTFSFIKSLRKAALKYKIK